MAHPVRPASYMKIDNFYTLTVYEKGAEVIRMYHTLLGEAGFRRGPTMRAFRATTAPPSRATTFSTRCATPTRGADREPEALVLAGGHAHRHGRAFVRRNRRAVRVHRHAGVTGDPG